MTTKRVLPADVFDTLELSALVWGGIGAGEFYESDDWDNSPPLCLIGHCWEADTAVPPILRKQIPLVVGENDRAVRTINNRLGKSPNTRVTFRQWCKELGVERGS